MTPFERWMNRPKWVYRLVFVRVRETPNRWSTLRRVETSTIAPSKRTAYYEVRAWLGLWPPVWRLKTSRRGRRIHAEPKRFPGSERIVKVDMKNLQMTGNS